uniref:Uncharacterized protein n=1 Tax=Mustela putorius furo TaxID=9669 RepID=M3XYU4_MUSPF
MILFFFFFLNSISMHLFQYCPNKVSYKEIGFCFVLYEFCEVSFWCFLFLLWVFCFVLFCLVVFFFVVFCFLFWFFLFFFFFFFGRPQFRKTKNKNQNKTKKNNGGLA